MSDSVTGRLGWFAGAVPHDRCPTEPVSPQAPPIDGRVMMDQQWRDLLFVHWAVDPARVAPLLPPGVHPDVLDQMTYVGLVPFSMVGAGFGRGHPVPWFGTFLETNVRVYTVDDQGRRGVRFLSLDADRSAVVVGARVSLGMPYRWARMSHQHLPGPGGAVEGSRHRWTTRLRPPWRPQRSEVAVRVGAEREPDARDEFLSARWRAHTRLPATTMQVPNRHERWRLHDVELLHLDDGLLAGHGFGDLVTRPPDQTAFGPGVHAVFGFPRTVHPIE